MLVRKHQDARKRGGSSNTTAYTFDVSKTEEILDFLVQEQFITLPFGHILPSTEELQGKDYCKYHDTWTHSTNNCWAFRNAIQERIDKGVLKFPEKKKESMLIDEDPFPPVATINSVTYSLRDPSDARRDWRPRYSHPTRRRSRVYTRYRLPYPQNVWRREPGHQAKPRRDQATQTGPIWDTLGEPSGRFDYLVDYSPKTVFTVTGKPTGWDVMPEQVEAPKKKK